ncbi:tetratricopeptide repeat protein [Nitrospira sp. Kam-Ns4a]
MHTVPLSSLLMALLVGMLEAAGPSFSQGRSPAAASRPGAPVPPDSFTLPDWPDDGPRVAGPGEGPAAAVFERGTTSYRQGHLPEARLAFQQVVEQHPSSPLVEPARAFLAELLVREKPGPRGMMEAIEAYRALLLERPGSPNARRARWRIGDLYAAMGLRIEAQGSYERALTDLPDGPDADRAWLGLALNDVGWARWGEAEQAFRTLRQHTRDERLRQYATVGLADVLVAARRPEEAEALYRTAMEQWPEFLKRRPASLLRYAALTRELGREADARRLYGIAYNLRPWSDEAPEALVQIGDSFRRHGALERAGLFYELAVARHPGTLGAALARLRLAELGHERLAARPTRALHETVRTLLRAGPVPWLDPAGQRRVLHELAATYERLVLGSEAGYHLAEMLEADGERTEAIRAYEAVVARAGRLPDDPWPERASGRLAGLLAPDILLALDRGDDLAAVTLYYRLGVFAERVFADSDLLLRIAGADQRLGFLPEAVRLYQVVLRSRGAQAWREAALIGLGQTYLAQRDFAAARQVFDRYRLQYPLGRWGREALRGLAEASLEAGDPASAVRVSRQWLARYPTQPARPAVLLTLAAALVAQGNRAEALRWYAEAERAGGLTDPRMVLRYADLLAEAGRGEAALVRYGRVLQEVPTGGAADWARFQIVRLRRAQDDPATVEVALEALLAEAADPVMARLAVALAADLAPRRQEAGTDGDRHDAGRR